MIYVYPTTLCVYIYIYIHGMCIGGIFIYSIYRDDEITVEHIYIHISNYRSRAPAAEC